MDGTTPPTSATDRASKMQKMSYSERLANYELEKAQIHRNEMDYKTYEQVVRTLAKKWRI